MLRIFRLKTLGLAMVFAGAAQAQSLEEALIVLYDPVNANAWEFKDGAYLVDRLALDGHKTTEREDYRLSIKDCVITVAVKRTKPASPSDNSAFRATFDLNKVSSLIGLELKSYGHFATARPKWQFAKGGYCLGLSPNGVNARIPDKAENCEAPDIMAFGMEATLSNRQILEGEAKAAEDRLRKAYAFVREKYCKGRAF